MPQKISIILKCRDECKYEVFSPCKVPTCFSHYVRKNTPAQIGAYTPVTPPLGYHGIHLSVI